MPTRKRLIAKTKGTAIPERSSIYVGIPLSLEYFSHSSTENMGGMRFGLVMNVAGVLVVFAGGAPHRFENPQGLSHRVAEMFALIRHAIVSKTTMSVRARISVAAEEGLSYPGNEKYLIEGIDVLGRKWGANFVGVPFG